MTTIDLRRINDKIRRRFWARYGVDERMTKCFKQVWGWPDCNDVGVFNQTEEIAFELKGQKMWHAEIDIAVAPNGWHTYATNYCTSTQGGGYAPSVTANLAYTTREEAIDAALMKLIGTFEELRDSERPDTDTQKRNAEKMIEMLEARLTPEAPYRPAGPARDVQLSLFV